MKFIKNSKSKSVKLRDKYVNGFPITSIKEEYLWISEDFTFSHAIYIAPKGDSKVGRLEIKLLNDIQEIQFFWIEIDFKHSENERIEDAKKPSSFKIHTNANEVEEDKEELDKKKKTNPFDKISILDVTNKYEDVIIESVKPDAHKNCVEVHFFIQKENTPKTETFSTIIDHKAEEEKKKIGRSSLVDEIDINTLRYTNQEVKVGATLTLEDLVNFKVSDTFLSSSPPAVPQSDIVIPEKGIELQKVTYMPPNTIDSRMAYLQVEYKKGERSINERVAFEFPTTIRQAATEAVHLIPSSEFKYVGPSTYVTPVEIIKEHFSYDGALELEITGVEKDDNLDSDDSRFTHATLLVTYRTAVVKVPLTLEFELSRNEYKHKSKTDARTENGSIVFDNEILTPKILFEANEGNEKALKEIIKSATIVNGYPYDRIDNIKVINFLPESRIAMFKVTAIEMIGHSRIVHVFEKQHMMKESYNEYKLESLKASDVEVDYQYVSDYPPQSLHEKTFVSTDEYTIQWIQYVPPHRDAKRVDVKIKVVSGKKSRFLIKKLTFPLSIGEHLIRTKKAQVMKFLRAIKATDLTIDVDFSGEPVEKITPEDIIGVPAGVECEVSYSKPKLGNRSTRIIVKLKRDKHSIGFEQTLMFEEPTR